MADIFISYSSKDRDKAELLTELLSSAGLSVWIDQAGLEVSNSWSKEIVQAINDCKAFLVLLSPNSLESHNVIKEVSLASEKRKKILPLELEPITLTDDFEYQLAGIHRTSMTNIDSIIRALGKLGFEATQAPSLKLVKEIDSRKSLMILPFQDLSPTGDNGWFADGIVSELIQAFSNVKSIQITDAQTTKDFKRYQGTLPNYAREMQIRYFVEGDVRKFGDQIKINTRLLDIETGDHLWQDSLKGTMDDIFDIQETVAKKVVEGLNVILTKDEEKKIKHKSTDNAEAYELYLKANEYFSRHTRSDYERAITLYENAIQLDEYFTSALLDIANTLLTIYRVYSRNPQLLTDASKYIEKVESITGESPNICRVRSILSRNLGNAADSLRYAERSIELKPDYLSGYYNLSFALQDLGRLEESSSAMKRCVDLEYNDRNNHFSYIICLQQLGDSVKLAEAARNAIPIYERHLRLSPDDVFSRVAYASILGNAGELERSLQEARKIEEIDGLDGFALYNLACCYLQGNDSISGLRLLRRAVDQGFSSIEEIKRDQDLDPLRGMPEFEAIVKEVEERIAAKKDG